MNKKKHQPLKPATKREYKKTEVKETKEFKKKNNKKKEEPKKEGKNNKSRVKKEKEVVVSEHNASLIKALDLFHSFGIPSILCHGIKEFDKESRSCSCRRKVCGSPGKHPRGRGWVKNNLDNTNHSIREILRTKPNGVYNLAALTGVKNKDSGKYLLVVDFDRPDNELYKELSEKYPTLEQVSGSGKGNHLFYWSDVLYGNSVSLLADKVDIRCNNGILILAPSRHISGGIYKLKINDVQNFNHNPVISDIPPVLKEKLDLIETNRKKKTKTSSKKTKGYAGRKGNESQSLSPLAFHWQNIKVPEILLMFSLHPKKKNIVPMGVRNMVMHRLLSSCRAKGAGREELEKKANEYVKHFARPKSFSQEEINGIIGSVMKYPAYNNSFERINEIFFKWLKANKREVSYKLEDLDRWDNEFFSTDYLEITEKYQTSLSDVLAAREFFILKHKGLNCFSNYSLTLLAKKLTSLGYSSKRNAKCVLWNVKINMPLAPSLKLTYPLKRMENAMTENNNTEQETLSPSVPGVTPPRDVTGKSQAKLNHGEIIIKDGQLFKVEIMNYEEKKKYHSREHLYQGRKGIEYNGFLFKYLNRLTEEQKDLWVKRSLVLSEEKTKELLATIQVGDIIGVDFNSWVVKEVKEDGLIVNGFVYKDSGKSYQEKPGKYSEISFSQLDISREMGLFNILKRDGNIIEENDSRNKKLFVFLPLTEEEKNIYSVFLKKNESEEPKQETQDSVSENPI